MKWVLLALGAGALYILYEAYKTGTFCEGGSFGTTSNPIWGKGFFCPSNPLASTVPAPAPPVSVQPTQTQVNSGGPVFPKPGDPLFPVRVTPVPGGPCGYAPPCNPGEACSQIIIGGRYDSNLVCQPFHLALTTIPPFAVATSGGGPGQM